MKNKIIDKNDPNREETIGQTIWEFVRFAFIAVIIVIPIRIFIAQPFIVSGSSMHPTFEDKEYLVVDEISYRLSEPSRGDVAIFKYPLDEKKYYIKRIIGLPNDIIDLKGSDVIITNKENPDGFKIEQPFVRNNSKNDLHFELKDGEYFVLGDNRTNSSDSRMWGPVPEKDLVGRAFLRLLPISKISLFPGAYKLLE